MINAGRPETAPTTRSVLKALQADVTDSGSSREDDDIVLFGPERQQQPAGDPIQHNAPLNSQQAAVMSLCTLYFQEKVQHGRGAGSRLQPLRVLVHGGPGTGKSFLTKRIQERAEEMGLQIACMALTGIAAGIMPQGTTCHHRLAIRCGTTHRRPTPLQREKLLQLQCKLQKESLAMVIIDEVSFVTPEMLDIIAGRLAEIMGVDSIDPAPGDVSAPTPEPLAIVLMGDFFQLPPVPPDTLFTALINQFVREKDINKATSHFRGDSQTRQRGAHFFSTFRKIELTQVSKATLLFFASVQFHELKQHIKTLDQCSK